MLNIVDESCSNVNDVLISNVGGSSLRVSGAVPHDSRNKNVILNSLKKKML